MKYVVSIQVFEFTLSNILVVFKQVSVVDKEKQEDR